jgi:hypothetical protein
MTILIGTSGFSYKDWVGPVYPEGLPRQLVLRAGVLPTEGMAGSKICLHKLLDTTANTLYNTYRLYKEVCVWNACSAPLKRGPAFRNW